MEVNVAHFSISESHDLYQTGNFSDRLWTTWWLCGLEKSKTKHTNSLFPFLATFGKEQQKQGKEHKTEQGKLKGNKDAKTICMLRPHGTRRKDKKHQGQMYWLMRRHLLSETWLPIFIPCTGYNEYAYTVWLHKLHLASHLNGVLFSTYILFFIPDLESLLVSPLFCFLGANLKDESSRW